MPQKGIYMFTFVFIAKDASQEVRRKRVGGCLGAAYIKASVLKPLFLKLLATFQNDRTSAIINVHQTLVCVASGEQRRETYAVAVVPLLLLFDRVCVASPRPPNNKNRKCSPNRLF